MTDIDTTIIDIITRHGDDRDVCDAEIYAEIGISGPGAVMLIEPDERVMIWASESDSEDDDGSRAAYRSSGPICDAAMDWLCRMAWIDEI